MLLIGKNTIWQTQQLFTHNLPPNKLQQFEENTVQDVLLILASSVPWLLTLPPWIACSKLGQEVSLPLARFVKYTNISSVIHGTLPNVSIPYGFLLLAILSFLL